MRQTITADGGSDVDLTTAVPTVTLDRADNNEQVRLYPTAGDAEYGIVEHRYDGLPARGTVRYDVVGWEIVDAEIEPEQGRTAEEELDLYRSAIEEWIDEVLFRTEPTRASATVRDEGHHTIRVIDDQSGDEYVVELDTENERRIA